MKTFQEIKKCIKTEGLEEVLSVKTFNLFSSNATQSKNPVVQAHRVWGILSEQLNDVLGEDIYTQWFKDIRPIVLTEDILILKTPCTLSSIWIKNHYQKLVDLLAHFIDKEMSVFFLCPDELKGSSPAVLEGFSSKVDSSEKDSYCQE